MNLNMSQMTLSHEFRAPLSSSLMMLETILHSTLTAQARAFVQCVVAQINLLLCLVNDILDLKMLH